MSEWVHSVDVQNQLKVLRYDYEEATRSPFDYFFCPILFKDERVELCMGHVVSDCIPNSSGARVVQRKDVDGFYGAAVEADFATVIEAGSRTAKDAVFDPELSKKLKPRILAPI